MCICIQSYVEIGVRSKKVVQRLLIQGLHPYKCSYFLQNQRRIEQLEDENENENENADASSDIATLQDEIKGIKTEIYYMRDERKRS